MRFSDALFAAAIIGCAASQKPFDQMTAQEHRDAAAREYELADHAFEQVTGADIEPPETMPYGDGYDVVYPEYGGYGWYGYEVGAADAYTAWPRVSDPSEKYEDRAIKHRETAMRHERAAAALEGRPSPQPLPPPTEDPLLGPDQG
ncbi:MAG TPA: hypothetical protein VL326_19295 [Kofleriaceae bacterium]|jgi:hypothetical protein|nr:hypothetical protein [Kofleriaceae bacterium]